jgi:ankyrin repeat protein
MTIVKLLLEHGTKVNHTQNDGATSLYIACEEKHLDIVKLLVDYDADPTIGIHTGISPMYNACEKENLSSRTFFEKQSEPEWKISKWMYTTFISMHKSLQGTILFITKLRR